ncbi:hypothetical protein Pst134EA_009410 [Puccinia striiformis f. sp. tritici]|uniref:hypothetical protein n=1 Tax=Puccinia striiformis f. sp. tritici TaxID=168172 RepID=UPI00200888F2|nr:hypothetical protein Pst134EA_009410 [Puccinia striiformis f. sp. tritici]KAH9468881.1 hypothetical protein Pst134EA_009410 [Puccinia striiformis f. sp. tritici]
MSTQALVEFINDLPLSINPYEATAKKIKQETQSAVPVLWGLILRRITAFSFFILCIQTMTALWLRAKANKLHFFRCNKLGLIHVELLNETVLLLFMFSLLGLVDLVTQEWVDKGLLRFSSKMVLQVCKFPIADVVSWSKSSSHSMVNFVQLLELCTDATQDSCSNNATKSFCGSSVSKRQ